MTSETKQLTAADSNKLLKKALRKAFPGTKFSVRMSRGTGYGNAWVRWTDGPSTEEVQKVIAPFEGQGFDGMTDSSYYKDTAIEIDGVVYRSGLRMVNVQRDVSDEAMQAKIAELEADGWTGRFESSMACAARSILNGVSVLAAADFHHLQRS